MVLFNDVAVFDWTHFAIRAQAHANGFNCYQLNIRGRDPASQDWTTYGTSATDPGNSGWVDYTINGNPTIDGIRIEDNDGSDYLVLGSVEAWGTWYAAGKSGQWVPDSPHLVTSRLMLGGM